LVDTANGDLPFIDQQGRGSAFADLPPSYRTSRGQRDCLAPAIDPMRHDICAAAGSTVHTQTSVCHLAAAAPSNRNPSVNRPRPRLSARPLRSQKRTNGGHRVKSAKCQTQTPILREATVISTCQCRPKIVCV